MANATHTEARFNDENAAREHLESIRWPNGAICPHCGGADRQSKLDGQAHRPGLYFCGHCRKQYTVTVGTVFERSKIPLHKWLYANHLICASKKGAIMHLTTLSQNNPYRRKNKNPSLALLARKRA